MHPRSRRPLCTVVTLRIAALATVVVVTGPRLPGEPTIVTGWYEGRAQLVVGSLSATYVYDRLGGGFSRLIDREGFDWICFRKEPLKQAPQAAAAGFRGLPNLAFGRDNPDAGAGHPGFDRCVSEAEGTRRIRTKSLSGRWEWTWTFGDEAAVLSIEKADATHPYWFLYEGPVGGQWNPRRHYWGTDRGGPRRDLPDQHHQLFGRWRWAYFGDDDRVRVLLVVQEQEDALVDTFWYMGATTAQLAAPDGMVVFGFGRGPGTMPLLRGPGLRFAIGFVEGRVTGSDGHEAVARKAQAWIAAMAGERTEAGSAFTDRTSP